MIGNLMEWMLDIQLGRRNLSPIQRIAVAEKYRPIYEKQAKDNLRVGGKKGGLANSSKPSQNSSKASSVDIDNKIDVRAKLAKTASVSTDTYSKGKKILDSDNEELKQEVLSGEKTINAGYKELTRNKKEEKTNADKKSKFYQKSLTENLPQAISTKGRNSTTDKKLSDIAGVSEKTYRMGAKVLNSSNENVKTVSR